MKKTIHIKGMSCGHCVNAVKNIILEIKGVTSVKVSLENKNAEVEYEQISITDVVDEINDTNYEASLV